MNPTGTRIVRKIIEQLIAWRADTLFFAISLLMRPARKHRHSFKNEPLLRPVRIRNDGWRKQSVERE
jgi:hypothetical protein